MNPEALTQKIQDVINQHNRDNMGTPEYPCLETQSEALTSVLDGINMRLGEIHHAERKANDGNQ